MIEPEPVLAPTILVVDTAEGIRHVFAGWLRRAGYSVHEAASGAAALELLARVSVDLVLLDGHLPDLSGSEVCEQIMANRATAGIPVLHVRATATEAADRTTGLNRGADGYLTEPVQREELLATVTALLRHHDARRGSEGLASRLERLHEATLLINAASTVSDLLQVAAAGLAELFGCRALVMIVRVAAGWPAQAAPNELQAPVSPHDAGQLLAVATVLRQGGPLDLSGLGVPLGLPAPSGAYGSPIATPRGELVGALVLLSTRREPEDELVLDHFAQTLSVAIENQRLYDTEHKVALTLQHAMLPKSLPRPDHLEIAVRYQAASDIAEIGGDFYEAIELDGLTTLLVVGDVAGHSLHAATVMAELRYSLRALARLGLRPAEIVERLNLIICESHPGLTATICIAEVNAAAAELRICNAGHLPPLVRAGAGVDFVTGHGPLLGLRGAAAPPTITVPFGAGSLVVLSTDGLTERRGESMEVGLARLRAAVRAHTGNLEQLCDRLLRDVGAGAEAFDDIAIIAARAR